jgi:UDP:flavonoid glycosyltransferase YjiC (YdhE family)
MLPAVQATGFTGFASGSQGGDTTQKYPLLEVSMEREEQVLREFFAGRIARERAADILALCATQQPDLIVCDEIDFGSMVAAERLGLPYASVLVIAAGSFVRRVVVGEPLNALRAEHGLASDPELAMLSRYLVLSPFPPSYRDPLFPLPATAHSIRPSNPHRAASAPRPTWISDLQGRPTAYFTLGTVFNRESGDLFSRVLSGLSDLPINLIVTVGQHINPAEFAPQPAHVHIEQYIPQSVILPHCDVVISHGGSGSVMGALAHGLPAVLIPMGADQPLNAARCEALGVGRTLDVVTATAEDIRAAVVSVLETPSYRLAAERIREGIASLPDVSHALVLLERLGQEKRAIVAG